MAFPVTYFQTGASGWIYWLKHTNKQQQKFYKILQIHLKGQQNDWLEFVLRKWVQIHCQPQGTVFIMTACGPRRENSGTDWGQEYRVT